VIYLSLPRSLNVTGGRARPLCASATLCQRARCAYEPPQAGVPPADVPSDIRATFGFADVGSRNQDSAEEAALADPALVAVVDALELAKRDLANLLSLRSRFPGLTVPWECGREGNSLCHHTFAVEHVSDRCLLARSRGLAGGAFPPRTRECLHDRPRRRLPTIWRLSGLAIPALLVSVSALVSVYRRTALRPISTARNDIGSALLTN
jgi:hypothetical protein